MPMIGLVHFDPHKESCIIWFDKPFVVPDVDNMFMIVESPWLLGDIIIQ